jgi:hypothetical protein
MPSLCLLTNIQPVGDTVAVKATKMELHIDEIDSEMIDYIAKHGKARAGELSEPVEIMVL